MLARDAATGRLTDASCVDFLPEPSKPEPGAEESSETKKKDENGKGRNANAAADPCQSVPGLESVHMLAVSGDGSSVWAFGLGLGRELQQGPHHRQADRDRMRQLVRHPLREVGRPRSVRAAAVSPDGRNVYIATGNARALVAFGVGAAVTAASASANRAGVAHVAVACPGQLTRPCHGRLVLTRRSRIDLSPRRPRSRVAHAPQGDRALHDRSRRSR